MKGMLNWGRSALVLVIRGVASMRIVETRLAKSAILNFIRDLVREVWLKQGIKMSLITQNDLIKFNGQEIRMEIRFQDRLIACVTGKLDARNISIVIHNEGNFVFFEPEHTELRDNEWIFRVPIRK
jgi:hypothetical protein